MWSLDWFAAEKLARQGAQIRRVAWTDKVLIHESALWYLLSGTTKRVVTANDFSAEEFGARDWTDQPFNANPCAAAPSFNTGPLTYSEWNAQQPRQDAPPPPGFPSA